MSLQIIRVCIEQQNYMSVQSHVAKIKNLRGAEDADDALKPILSAALGLANLASGTYREAARNFLECPPTLGSTFSDVISPNDIAIYGGLCALASMDRKELKTEVLDNGAFRNFLELEPYMRRAIVYFHTAKYSSCLEILEQYKNDYLLDIHLHRHVKAIYAAIRSKAIVNYFMPFSCVTLAEMARAFGTSEAKLEEELVSMIEKGVLNARIDKQNRLLTAKEADLRSTLHRDTLAMTQAYERQARMKLVRMNMIRAGLDVRGSKLSQGSTISQMVGRAGGFMERFS